MKVGQLDGETLYVRGIDTLAETFGKELPKLRLQCHIKSLTFKSSIENFLNPASNGRGLTPCL